MKNSSVSKALLLITTLAALQLSACGQQPQETAPPAASSELGPQTQQRINDLVTVNAALEQYHATHNGYPVSNQMQGYASQYGGSLGANWIPELGQALPRDPAGSEAGNESQYLYVSDGVDYKLIAHVPGDCSSAVETNGVRIDPRRSDAQSCWAYGFWSANGEGF